MDGEGGECQGGWNVRSEAIAKATRAREWFRVVEGDQSSQSKILQTAGNKKTKEAMR